MLGLNLGVGLIIDPRHVKVVLIRKPHSKRRRVLKKWLKRSRNTKTVVRDPVKLTHPDGKVTIISHPAYAKQVNASIKPNLQPGLYTPTNPVYFPYIPLCY